MSTYTHRASLSDLTVYATDADTGETTDLNATGEPCANATDLRAFVSELRKQGLYGRDVETALLAECASVDAPAATLPAPRLVNYQTGEDIRTATSEEMEAGKAAAETDGGAGVILVDGVPCYVG